MVHATPARPLRNRTSPRPALRGRAPRRWNQHRHRRSSRRPARLRPAAQVDARSLDQLRAEIERLSLLRRSGRYTKLAIALPATLEELTLAIHTRGSTAEREQAFRLLVDAFYAAHGLAYRLGYGDLAESIEHKLAWAAEHSGDPLAIGLAQWTRVNSFQAAGDYDRSLQLLDTARAHLNSHLAAGGPAAITVYGSMHLRAVTLASRAGNADTTQAHLHAARDLATRIQRDQVHYQLTFGPTNTAIHDIAAAVELGNAERAVTVATTLKTPRGLPATRVGHHYLDLARAHLMLGDRPGTLAALENARRAAPEQTRYHPMVRETARVLVSLHHRANPELTRFATWLGLAD